MNENKCVSASAVFQFPKRKNMYQEEIDNIPNLTMKEMEKIFKKDGCRYGSNFWEDQDYLKYIGILKKFYATKKVRGLIKNKYLNNVSWVFKKNLWADVWIETTEPYKKIGFVLTYQAGFVYLDDKIWMSEDDEEENIFEIHSDDALRLLSFIKEQGLNIVVEDKEKYVKEINDSIEKYNSSLIFLNNV